MSYSIENNKAIVSEYLTEYWGKGNAQVVSTVPNGSGLGTEW